MATKKTKSKKRKKPSSPSAASNRPKSKKGAPTKATAKKTSAPKKKPKKAAKKRAAPKLKKAVKAQAAPSPKAFVEKVRDCDAGTGIWFIVAGSVEHASIQKRGNDGAVVIVTDAGVTEVVPVGNLFETADEARAARQR